MVCFCSVCYGVSIKRLPMIYYTYLPTSKFVCFWKHELYNEMEWDSSMEFGGLSIGIHFCAIMKTLSNIYLFIGVYWLWLVFTGRELYQVLQWWPMQQMENACWPQSDFCSAIQIDPWTCFTVYLILQPPSPLGFGV